MTIEHTDHEHNESYDAQNVDETVAGQQHTPETETPVADASPSTEETYSAPSVSHDDTDAARNDAFLTEQTSSTEEDAQVATTAFAEESGMTIPELSTFVSPEDLHISTGQEETSSSQEASEAPVQQQQDTQPVAAQEASPSTTSTEENSPCHTRRNSCHRNTSRGAYLLCTRDCPGRANTTNRGAGHGTFCSSRTVCT